MYSYCNMRYDFSSNSETVFLLVKETSVNVDNMYKKDKSLGWGWAIIWLGKIFRSITVSSCEPLYTIKHGRNVLDNNQWKSTFFFSTFLL